MLGKIKDRVMVMGMGMERLTVNVPIMRIRTGRPEEIQLVCDLFLLSEWEMEIEIMFYLPFQRPLKPMFP